MGDEFINYLKNPYDYFQADFFIPLVGKVR